MKKNYAPKIILGFFLSYIILGLIDLYLKKISAADMFTFAAIFLFIYFFANKYKTRTAILAGILTLPHLFGLWGLYGANIFNYNYDLLEHFIVAILGAIVIMDFLQFKFKKSTYIVTFFVIIGLGSLIEITEYLGFVFVGFGESYLGFGSGDNNQNFGPWANASLDMIFNSLGSILGLIFYKIFNKKN